MSLTVLTPKEIIDSFPEVPATIPGVPTYPTLKALRQTLKNNASTVDTIHGGGLHGHLGLVLPAHIYNLIVIPLYTGTNSWIDPVQPALVPAYPPNATAEQMEEICAAHKEQLRCWKLCANVNTTLRTLLLQAIQPIYV